MGKQKSIPELRFPEFNGEWETKILKEYIVEHRGGAPLTPNDFVKFSTYEVIPKKGISSGGELQLDSEKPTFCSESFYNKYKKSVIDNSYLITILRDLVPSGPSIGYIVKNKSNKKYILAQGVYGLKINIKKLSEDFLIQYSNTKSYRTLMQTIMVGSTQVHIRNSTFFGIKIISPSLPEQQKIANFLIRIDQKLLELKKKKNLLTQYKKGVMQKIFSQEIRFRDENSNEYPAWENKKMGEVAKFSKGKGISKADISDYGKNECIRYGELYTFYGEVIDEIKSKTDIELNNMVISEANDVIIPASGETQIDIATASCVLKSGVGLGGDLNIIKSKNNGVFLSYYLNNRKKYDIANLAQGISVVHLYSSQLALLDLDIPCLEEQIKIANFLSAIDDKIKYCTTQIEKTEQWKKGLLQKMFV